MGSCKQLGVLAIFFFDSPCFFLCFLGHQGEQGRSLLVWRNAAQKDAAAGTCRGGAGVLSGLGREL